MGKVLFNWILVGIMIKMTGSIEISDSQSGSKSCNLTLRINPSLVFFTGYQSLEIFKHANTHSDYSLPHCRVHSVEIRRGFRGKIPLKRKFFTRMVTKKHSTNLEVILQNRDFKHLPVEDVFVLVELDCNGRRCSVLSADDIKKIYPQSPWMAQRRKLLSLRADNSVDDRDLPVAAPVLVAVVGIIVLIVALAMCACGNNTHEKALSDEVGGTEVDHHVVAVSTVRLEEGQKIPEHVTPVKSENENSSNDRRNTNQSKKSERNSQSTTENGAVNATERTASQSSQLDKRSLGEVEPLLRSSGSRNSVDKVEEAALESSAPEKGTESVTPERKRTASDKEVPPTEKESKDNNSSSEVRTRTDSSEGAKKSIFRKGSRKRMGSDGKEPKSSPEENAEQKKSFWQRRKSSKTKGNIENIENISPKKDKKKKKNESQKTPEHVPSSSRHTNLPLPPRPSSVSDEETQYEVVESRAQRPKSNAEDADYESVTTSKTRTYDKVNVLPKDQSRPASELYECINDQDAKMKRASSGSNQYDVVETRTPPKKQPASLEYAYAVVASRDKPLTPTETSGSSGLYEVVTDDIKQQSGVLDKAKSDSVVEDPDYAVVQKDPAKKRASKKEEEERYAQAEKQREKSLSGEIRPVPAPPTVSSLIHISSSVRRRTQSEGDELNTDSPTDPASDRPQTMFEVDETYAKVNLAMKKRHSVEVTHSVEAPHSGHEFAPPAVLPGGFYEESETPPPVPPSLYADLESMREEDDKANDNHPSSSTQPEGDSEENAYEEVATKVEIKSITSRPIKTVSDLKITQAKDRTENQMEPLKSPEDPNGVLKRLKPPVGSPRNSDGRLSASSLEDEKRFSSGSQHNYDEVLTKNAKTTQADKSSTTSKSSRDSTTGHYESIESKRNSAGYDVVNQKQKPTTSQTDDKIVTYV